MEKKCQKCKSERVLEIQGKVSDCFDMWDNQGREYSGYVPDDLGIGGNKDIQFHYCLECGQIQGEFPVTGEVEVFLEFEDDIDYDAIPEHDLWKV